jgi:hypothetical protein
MRKRVVSIISWPVRFLRRLLGLLLRPFGRLFKRRGTPKAPPTPQDAQPVKPGKADKPAKPAKPARSGRLAKLGRPFRRIAGLKGKPRIAALAILGVVVVVALLSLRPGPNTDKQVRDTLARYATATRQKDYQTLCDKLYAKDLVEHIRAAGLPCEVALKTGLDERQNPQLTVLGVEVTGDQALAKARATATGETPALVTIKLVRDGGDWRVASLVDPGTQAPAAAAP